MRKAKRLNIRQLAFIGDLFGGKLSEEEALKKHCVSRRLYNKWLTIPAFAEEFDRRIAGLYRQNALLIARNASEAMEELMKLIKGKEESTEGKTEGSEKKPEKGETVRKACLDIIKMHLSPRQTGRPKAPDKKAAPPPEMPRLSPQTAGKLLAVLAEEKTNSVS
ncbi:MAG: hypothetical protein JXM79_06165 [Sedimentisphaerales bacterium]|nr:hypothetical protein [Sedimentisphaerales bacterium]